MLPIRLIGSVSILALLTSGAIAQVVPDVAVVEGIVTDAATGQPIPGAWVLLESQTRTINPPAVRTDESGRYRAEVPSDDYHFRIDASGFRVLETRTGGSRPPMMVRAGTVVTADHRLSRGATIAGRVADDQGNPVAGALVVAEEERDAAGGRVRELYRSGAAGEDGRPVTGQSTTDEEGRFSIAGFGEGDYYVVAIQEPVSPVYYPGTTVRAGAVPIRVTEDAAQFGQHVGGVEIRWRPVPMVPIRGRVVGVAEPENFGVDVQMDLPLRRTAAVDPDGRFEVWVPPGEEYDLFASPRIGSAIVGNGGREGGFVTVFAGDDGADDVTLSIVPFGSLEGDIVWESVAPAGIDVDGMSVGLEFAVPNGAGRMMTSPREGEFRLENVRPVAQRLRVDGVPDGVYVESARFGSVDALRGEFNPALNPNARLRIVLGDQAGEVSGAVMSGNDPVSGAVVTLVPDGARRGRLDLFQTATANGEGRFAFDTVPPGTYLVFGWSSNPGDAIENEQYRLPYEARAARVYVDRLGSAEVEVGVIP